MPLPEALESEVLRFYVALAAALLAGAGAAIAALRWGLGRDVAHAWDAFRGWAVMIPLVVVSLALGPVATVAFFTAVSIFAFKEFARATGLYRDWALTGAAYAGIVALGATAGSDGAWGALAPALAVSAILAVPVLRGRAEGQLKPLALAVFGFVYVGWMFGHLSRLAASPDALGYLLFLIVAVELNDVAAYTAGRLFGRRPLCPGVSPRKTWEGAAGGLAVSLLLPWALRFSLPGFSALECVAAGLVVGLGGLAGDLAVSVVKREVGVKDMGAAIPGHGGVLDRIDSLAYVAPLFYGVARMANG